MSTQPRVAAGVPAGGRYSTAEKLASDLTDLDLATSDAPDLRLGHLCSADELYDSFADRGFSEDAATNWARHGMTASEAHGYATASGGGFTPEDAADWKMHEFSPTVAAQWRNAGFDAPEADDWYTIGVVQSAVAQTWKGTGFTFQEAAVWRDAGNRLVDPQDAALWRDAGFNPAQAAKWSDTEIDPSDARGWADTGFTAGSAYSWARLGGVDRDFQDPHTAESWRAAGFNPSSGERSAAEWKQYMSPASAQEWVGRVSTPRIAAKWMESGFTPTSFGTWHDAGFTPEQARNEYRHGRTTPNEMRSA